MMNIEVTFPKLFERPSNLDINDDVERYGVGAFNQSYVQILISEIEITDFMNVNDENKLLTEPKITFRYQEDYSKNKSIGEFIDRAEKYAKDMVSKILKAAR
ncbi:hypothetical protein FE392_10965 [Xenorhabdus sp. 12]|uniref:Phage protein n=1 Tax=Xenorhabdus santafensis TaxID=2582833 RepID=A0ABU4SAM5_9GAMM|nr:hypothetical protein [Xenorhabdus sp. 12]MDX7987847.1 hypothetical protein [Xenorhabdus sp. 12]